MYNIISIIDKSNPLFGNLLIVLSQLMFSGMFIVEEKILRKYKVDIVQAVSWEGIWGMIFCSILLVLFSNSPQAS